MNKYLKHFPIALTVLSLVFLGLGLTDARSARDAATSRIKSNEAFISLGPIPGGKVAELTVVLKNQSSEKVTIVGGTRVCRGQYCVLVEDLPVEIMPFVQEPMRIRLFPKKIPGDFRCPVSFYTDENGSRRIDLEISGSVYVE